MLPLGPPKTPRSVERQFWRRIRAGEGVETAAAGVGVSLRTGQRWFRDGGGMPTVSLAELSGRYLSMQEREEIAVGIAAGKSYRAIGRELGRPASTIVRELGRNCVRTSDGRLNLGQYRASSAQSAADERARRPKTAKLVTHPQLRDYVQEKLKRPLHWSPAQIAHRLPLEFPDDERMRICHETIYQAIYVQGRGALQRELARCLRTGRTLRKPQRQPAERRGQIKNMISIAERPPEVDDRAVPGHWEGDMIVGKACGSAIGTLVERTTRFTMLLPLADQTAPTVRDAIASSITTLPEALRKTLTWDQGRELAEHAQLTIDTAVEVYFCDPHSPWQRPTNENTNGLLRQYFPKGTDLSRHPAEHLAEVAAALNGRPRKTLGWRTPAEALNELLLSTN